MVTFAISSQYIALLLEHGEELEPREAVSRCLMLAGHRPWPDMEAELFSGAHGSLLIARPRSPLLERQALPRQRNHGGV